MPTVFLLRDTSDNLWTIQEERELTNEEVQYVTEQYDEIYAANNTLQVVALHASKWKEASAQTDSNFKRLSTSLAELTRQDGSFDLNQFQLMSTSLSTQQRLPREACDSSLHIRYCSFVIHGGIPDSKQATQGGYIQYYSQYGRLETDAFRMPYCGITPAVRTQAVLGCGPSAFMGLVGRKYKSNGLRLFGKTASQAEFYYIRHRMTDPLGLRGRPLVANYMGTCWNTGGSQTLGKGFRDGGSDFLASQGSSLRVKSNFSHYDGNAASKQAKANILLQEIGDDENPVVTEYWPGAVTGHFSAVKAYHLYMNSGGGLLEVSVRTVDDPYTWYTLSGTWMAEVGLFYLN